MTGTCPACETNSLTALTDPTTGLEIDSCADCHGLWFDGNELSQLFPSRTLHHRLTSGEASLPPSQDEQQRPCPRCRQAMEKTAVADLSLDVCRLCQGIWFDRGELSALLDKVKNGLRGDPLVVNQVTLGLALESMATLHAEQRDHLKAICQFLAVYD
ncbi:MAG: zf-TFIIB domain-containing protein [Vulcanimicrobiota bacterium]